jgi:hypothetical protein
MLRGATFGGHIGAGDARRLGDIATKIRHPMKQDSPVWFVGLFFAGLVAFALIITALTDQPHPADIMFTDGTTLHCADAHWFGGGFGADNQFRCDGVTYTITSIRSVTRA